jgi:hypothetical protein
MTLRENTIVLAVACAACARVSPIPVYNNQPLIRRCGDCGQNFADPEALVESYRCIQQALAEHATLIEAHHAAVTALRDALAQWPRKAARVAVQRAAQALGLH